MKASFSSQLPALTRFDPYRLHGTVAAAAGLRLVVEGLAPWLQLGARLELEAAGRPPVPAEVVGFEAGRATALAFSPLEGIGPGTRASLAPAAALPVAESWLGRVIDPLGRPIDGRGPLAPGAQPRPLRAPPPEAGTRARLGPRLDLGVRALDAFATCRRGQRLGLFAASGVGKSTLLSMLAAGADCDVAVLALVGERGRELREFLEEDLGPAGLARSTVICATSDSPPLMRREAAYAALAVAEHFAESGRQVLLLMDSVTRFALALREIGLAAGEPPVTRGYTPGVFAELPRLLERAGPRAEGCPGAITGLFTVLVEGDDHDEPVADAVRGILDGHVVLDRAIGERGRYPAIDILRSLSRTVPGCLAPEEAALMRRARAILALHAEMADLVRLGAYRPGSDPAVDEAIRLVPRIEAMLAQGKGERGTVASAFAALAVALEDADAA
ncbi:flagellar protein export ATPase FliI [Belnapia sp. T6]|uniref:Flagellar protein export ATPase FliI n=1 Tax=Belnapia mucosa TaxID=2804532 RepID=A0ABS1UZB4_9PROT|nr:FliI/YscN family ATPase [Belnapia mucosa]MBL6454795.1 flagellar protein export ATPase FliI [Belnapia mucosa]